MTNPSYGLMQHFVSPFDFSGRTRINQRAQFRALIIKDLDIGGQLVEPESTTYIEGGHYLQDENKQVRSDLGAVRWSTPVFTEEDGSAAQLIRNEDLDADDRFKSIDIDPEPYLEQCDPTRPLATFSRRSGMRKVRTGKANLRATSAALPGDHPAIVIRGSEEFSQHLLMMPTWANALFANHRGDDAPSGSTLVADIAGSAIDKGRVGGIETVFKVVPDWKNYCPVALNMEVDPKRLSVSRGLFTSSGLFGFQNVDGTAHGYAGESGGGPLSSGAGVADRHRIGTNRDGEHIVQGHLQLATPWFLDPVRDAPPEVRLEAYEQARSGRIPWEVQMRYDPAAQHIGLAKDALPVFHQGLFRFQTFLPLFILPPPFIPYEPKKGGKKKKPGGRNPLPDPKGGGNIIPRFPSPSSDDWGKNKPKKAPIAPKPEDDGMPHGFAPIPGFLPPYDPDFEPIIPLPEDDESIRGNPSRPPSKPKPSKPGFGGSVTVKPLPPGTDPVFDPTPPDDSIILDSKRAAAQIIGIVDPLSDSRHFFGSVTRPQSRVVPGYPDAFTVIDSLESVGGSASQVSVGVSREAECIKKDQQIDKPRKVGIASTVHSVCEFSSQSFALFPRHVYKGDDFRYRPQASQDELAPIIKRTPAVGRLEVLGSEKGEAYKYTTNPGGSSRYCSGTGNGGWWLMPPEYDTDYLKSGTLPASYSTTYFGLWNARSARGTPILTGTNAGGVANGFSDYYDTTNDRWVIYHHDADGDATLVREYDAQGRDRQLCIATYGDGRDGNATISADTSYSENKFFENLEIESSWIVTAKNLGIFVKDTLTINASASINANGESGESGTEGGVAGGGIAANYYGESGGGGDGNVGAAGSAGSAPGPSLGGDGGDGGAGEGGTNAGGSGGTVTAPDHWPAFLEAILMGLARDLSAFSGGGGGGGGGAGSGVQGPGGGGGAGVLLVVARHLVVNTTGGAVFRAIGGSGGHGATTNSGGAGGGGGGFVCVVYQTAEDHNGNQLSVTQVENLIAATGGDGGNLDGTGAKGNPGSNGNKIVFKHG